jgi:glycosyltransferase involved in cell wall biosynthesis
LFDGLLAESRLSTLKVYSNVLKGGVRGALAGAEPSIFLNTGHSGLESPGYGAALRRHRMRPLFFLHDLIPISHPEYCRPGEADKHRRRVDLMLQTGEGLVLNSRDTLNALRTYAVQKGVEPPPCVVAPLAPGMRQAPSAVPDVPPQVILTPQQAMPYFVMLGTLEPRKNHLLILNVWAELVQTLGARCPRLVLIGQRGWECEQVVDMLERCPALQSVLIERPFCPDAELQCWLKGAQALLFPSFVEGFGMPLVEALMLRVPVIASRLPVFHEIAGDIPEYLHPLDGPAWRAMIQEYCQMNGTSRMAQQARMESYRPPGWDAHFDIVDELVERLDATPR